MKEALRRLDSIEAKIEAESLFAEFASWSDEEMLAELEAYVDDWRAGRVRLSPPSRDEWIGPDPYAHLSDEELLERLREEMRKFRAPQFEYCETCEDRTRYTYDRKLCLVCGASPALESEIRHWKEQLERDLEPERRSRPLESAECPTSPRRTIPLRPGRGLVEPTGPLTAFVV